MVSPNYISKPGSLPPELFSPQPTKCGLIFETCDVSSIFWGDPVPRGLAVAQVFLQFAALGDTVNLRGKFDASSAQRS